MKNSTLIKGTAAIAVGAALLLGGGGTLAAWNDSGSATPGIITAGNLDLDTTAAGIWKDRANNTIADIRAYRVVPGDKLTFTQDVNVTLVGDKMAASIAVVGTGEVNGFTATNVSVTGPSLTVGGAPITNNLTQSPNVQKVTAAITFEFLATTSGQSDVNKTFDFGNVGFTLQQVVAGAGLVEQQPQL